MLMLLIDAGLLHIGQIGAMKIAGTSTVCIALMMLGRTLQVDLTLCCHTRELSSNATQGFTFVSVNTHHMTLSRITLFARLPTSETLASASLGIQSAYLPVR